MILRILSLALCLTGFTQADETKSWPESKGSTWQGFQRLDFTLPDDGAKCFVVLPKEPAEGKPWIWRARFFGHQPALDVELLKRGWHVCYCDISNLYGSAKAVARWDAFHKIATGMDLSATPVLEGMSRGGLIIFNWASKNPTKVRAIYGDNPVCSVHSWPGGKGLGKGSPADWKRVLEAYDVDEKGVNEIEQPVSFGTLKPIAAQKIPVFLVLGEADKVVPLAENADPLAANYRKLGGPLEEWRKPGLGHHPHGLSPVEPLLEAILATEAD